MGDVTLKVPLRLLSVGRRAQGDNPAATGVERLADGLDCSPLSCRISAFEDEHQLLAGLFDPVLHLDQLEMQLRELVLVDAALEFASFLGHGAPFDVRLPTQLLLGLTTCLSAASGGFSTLVCQKSRRSSAAAAR